MRHLGGLPQILADESAEKRLLNSIRIGNWGSNFFNAGTKILIAVFISIYTIQVFFGNVPIWQLFAGNFTPVQYP